MTDSVEPGFFRRGNFWAIAWDVLHRQLSRVCGGRSAALVLLVCSECAEVCIFLPFS